MSKIQIKEIEKENYDPLSVSKDALFTQADFYGDWQEKLGKKVYRFKITKDDKEIGFAQFVECNLPFGKRYFICPYGPTLQKEHQNELVFKKIKTFFKDFFKNKAVFARLDFTPALNSKKELKVARKIFMPVHHTSVHGVCFQPRREWFLPLEKTEDEIMTEMHQKTRYNIRLSARKNVKIEIVTENLEKYIDEFYGVQSSTAKRNGFQLHEKEYYEEVLKSASKNKNGYLAIARLDDKILTVNFMINYGDIAMFAFGGSINEHRNLMPSYYAHWEGAKYAKSIGLKYYNFGGYFDENGPRIKKETLKKRSRFSIFKRKFGGFVLEHSPFFDVVVEKHWYFLYILNKFFRHV